MIPRLPAPVDSLIVPKYFSPSQWTTMETCPMKGWPLAKGQQLLRPSPEMLFGTLLHEVRRRFVREYRGGHRTLEVTRLLNEELPPIDAELQTRQTPRMGGLRQRVGWQKWADRIRRLEQWAEDVSLKQLHGREQTRVNAGDNPRETEPHDSFGLGVEPLWHCSELRLRGRPDEARRADLGTLEIVDYKTGSPLDADGQVRSEVATQLRLYGLMAERLSPGTRVRLFVHHRGVHEVFWNDDERRMIEDRLATFSKTFPAETSAPAPEAQRPGSHCIGCLKRISCGAYLRAAPSWWPNSGARPGPVPFDVWGRVGGLNRAGDLFTLRLADVAGRTVQVEGLDAGRDYSAITDEVVFFFDLQPTEDVWRHGTHVHPRNFHEVAPGPPWRDASNMEVFRE